MKIKGWDLDYFNSGEWQVVDERLKDLEKVAARIGNLGYNPGRQSLFKALSLLPAGEVRCAIIGQDPYPDPKYATGVAFSIPEHIQHGLYPSTLQTIFREYNTDLHYDIPRNGSLERWSKGGVLLWNAIPSCLPGRSLSHDWTEWSYLTREIVRRLSQRGIVFAFLGQVAKRYIDEVDLSNNEVIVTSHPSPRGSISSKTPFVGSRLFSTINSKLVNNGQEPIDWFLGEIKTTKV